MAEAGIRLQPFETGICSYEKDDPICTGTSFPPDRAHAVCEMLANLNSSKTGKGHFQPGFTIELEKIICRISGKSFLPGEIAPKYLEPIHYDLLLPEIKHLQTLDAFDLHSKEAIIAFVKAIWGSDNKNLKYPGLPLLAVP